MATSGVSREPNSAHRTRAVFLWNVVTFLLAGTAVCVWADYYTDRLPQIASLLGGGGALVWLTSAAGFFKSEHKEEFLGWTESAIFGRRWFSVLLIIGIVVFAAAAMQFGSVQVQSMAEEPDHSVQIRRAGTISDQWLSLPPAEHVRSLIWTPGFSPVDVAVKVKGYPEKVVRASALRRLTVYVPNSVRTPVVLLRPRIAVMDAARPPSPNTPPLLRIEITAKGADGAEITRSAPFDGHSIIIGGDEDITLPAELEEMWRAEAGTDRLDVFFAWKSPVAPDEFSFPLAPRQQVTVTLRQANGSPYGSPQSFIVNPVRGSRSFVQEVVLYGPGGN